MSHPNALLADLIACSGLSHAGLASRINQRLGTRHDHTSVARWVRDHAIPRGPQVICDLLSQRLGRPVDLSDIGMDRSFPLHSHSSPDLETAVARVGALWRQDARDATFLAGTEPVPATSVVMDLFDWENPPGDADLTRLGTGALGAGDIEALYTARHHYQEMYRRVGGVPVRPHLVRLLTTRLASALNASYTDHVGRRLFRAAGSLTALAGICTYDTDRRPALRMAKASRDRAFGSYVVVLLANEAMSRAEYRLVLQYCETALRASRGNLSPALVSDLASMQARAYARLGNQQSCHALMRTAETAAGRIRPVEEPSETSYVQDGLAHSQHAEALRRLGDLKAAEEYAREAVRTSQGAHLRGQVHRHAGLALIRAQAGRVDEALEPAGRTLELAVGMESGRLHERLRLVRHALVSRSGEPQVREFAERARAQLCLGL